MTTAKHSRPAPLDSDSMPLEGRHKIVRFDPTFNTGTIATIITIVSSAITMYTGVKTELAQQKADVDNIKAVAAVERSQTQAALADLKETTKDLQRSLSDIKQDLAVLRGRAAADTGGTKR